MAYLELMASAAFGLESVVARELKNLGYEKVKIQDGKVIFLADEAAICRSNLWLRCADRITVKMADFTAMTFEELFQQTKALPWEEWLLPDARFPVTGNSVKSQLHSVPDCQAIVKKAIVERLKSIYGISWFDENGSVYPIHVSLLKNNVTLSIDTTGPGLNKRGYRELAGTAPLKETLAAAMLYLSFWKKDRALLDPFCGTGTIPIEGAFIAQNRAPGLKRTFLAEQWTNVINRDVWQKARAEAEDLWDREVPLHIYGSDLDEKALRLARLHTQEAGLEGKIFFQKLPIQEVKSRFSYGYIVTNPPYGLRLAGEQGRIAELYEEIGELLKRLDTWSLSMLTAMEQPEQYLKRRWDRSRKLYNGKIECHLYQFFGPKPKNVSSQ